MIFVEGLLPGETSGVARVPEEVMEALPLVLEPSGTTEEVGVSIPTLETVSTGKAKEPSVVHAEVVGVEEEVESALVPVTETTITEQ